MGWWHTKEMVIGREEGREKVKGRGEEELEG